MGDLLSFRKLSRCRHSWGCSRDRRPSSRKRTSRTTLRGSRCTRKRKQRSAPSTCMLPLRSLMARTLTSGLRSMSSSSSTQRRLSMARSQSIARTPRVPSCPPGRSIFTSGRTALPTRSPQRSPRRCTLTCS
eukprot:Amastigsp_a509504_883.p3 type:complete len:132 gc:universal Amastigsp_a509504_883:1-396(+)